jgi:hypothetical protein
MEDSLIVSRCSIRTHYYRAFDSHPLLHGHFYRSTILCRSSGNPYWEVAMDEEYQSLMKSQTWELVPLPLGRKLFSANGFIEKIWKHMDL